MMNHQSVSCNCQPAGWALGPHMNGEDGGEKKNKMKDVESASSSQFDYLLCTVPDMHGIPRGRMVPKHLISKFAADGFGLYEGAFRYGLNMEVPRGWKGYAESNHGNALFLPIMDTARPLHWCATPPRRVGHAFCTMLTQDGSPSPLCTRNAAFKQVQRLDKMGLKIKSAFELEFKVYEQGNVLKPLGGGLKQFGNVELLDNDLDFFLDLLESLRLSELPVELFNTEYGFGQYELTMEPREGLLAADAAFMGRYGIHAFSRRRGYQATFMAEPMLPNDPNGLHLNHSLWSKDKGKNVLYDASDPKKLSPFARHWIAGLLHHSPALCALLCPTANCYQRFKANFIPTKALWGIDDRRSCIRVMYNHGGRGEGTGVAGGRITGVGGAEGGVYLENRLPSSACNPYLALAATIAAGLDGVERKLELPAQGQGAEQGEGPAALPKTLGKALELLEGDEVLKSALGSELVEVFTYVKREFEVKPLEEKLANLTDDEVVEKQRLYYMSYI